MGRVLLALALVIAGNSGQVVHAHSAAELRHRHLEWPAFHSGDLGAERHTHLVCFGVDLGSAPPRDGERSGQPDASWQSSDWIADAADGSLPLVAALAQPATLLVTLWATPSACSHVGTVVALSAPRPTLRV
jgi:hypothetical protein